MGNLKMFVKTKISLENTLAKILEFRIEKYAQVNIRIKRKKITSQP